MILANFILNDIGKPYNLMSLLLGQSPELSVPRWGGKNNISLNSQTRVNAKSAIIS